MAKKKTSVVLPGGIAGLVQQAQNAGQETTTHQVSYREEQEEGEMAKEPEPGRESQNDRTQQAKSRQERTSRVGESKGRSQKAASSSPRRGSSRNADVWDDFLEMAREYKNKQSKLATIYIDEDLKTVLDRLKTANSVKMPTAALLSSIVAQFIYANEKNIKDAIFDGSLI